MHILLSFFFGSTAQLKPWPLQNPAEFLGDWFNKLYLLWRLK